MGYLSRDAILQADDIQVEDVEIPEWGGMVRVRGMTGAQRDAFEASIVEQRGRKSRVNLKNLRARLVSLSIVDGEGNLIFSSADVQALGRKSAAGLQRVFNAAQRLSGLSDEDIEELTGNSSGQSDDSISD